MIDLLYHVSDTLLVLTVMGIGALVIIITVVLAYYEVCAPKYYDDKEKK